MKTFLDCYPCFVRQALDAARMAGADEAQQKAVLDRVLDALKQIGPSSTPPEMGDQIHRIVRQETGNDDPYRAAREACTRQALAFYPRLKALVAEADDPPETALRLSIAGNIIDLAPKQDCDLWENVPHRHVHAWARWPDPLDLWQLRRQGSPSQPEAMAKAVGCPGTDQHSTSARRGRSCR